MGIEVGTRVRLERSYPAMKSDQGDIGLCVNVVNKDPWSDYLFIFASGESSYWSDTHGHELDELTIIDKVNLVYMHTSSVALKDAFLAKIFDKYFDPAHTEVEEEDGTINIMRSI